MSAAGERNSTSSHLFNVDDLPPPYDLELECERFPVEAASRASETLVQRVVAATITHAFIQTAHASQRTSEELNANQIPSQSTEAAMVQRPGSTTVRQSFMQTTQATQMSRDRSSTTIPQSSPLVAKNSHGPAIYHLGFGWNFTNFSMSVDIPPPETCACSSSYKAYCICRIQMPAVWKVTRPSKKSGHEKVWNDGKKLHFLKLELTRRYPSTDTSRTAILFYTDTLHSTNVRVSEAMWRSRGAAKIWVGRFLTYEELNADLDRYFQSYTLRSTILDGRQVPIGVCSIATLCVVQKPQNILGEIIVIGQGQPSYSWTVSKDGKTLQYLDRANKPRAIVFLCSSPPRIEFSREFASRMLNADVSCDVADCSMNFGKVFLCHTCSQRTPGHAKCFCEAHMPGSEAGPVAHHHNHHILVRDRPNGPYVDVTQELARLPSLATLEQEMCSQEVIVGSLALIVASLRSSAKEERKSIIKGKYPYASIDMNHLVNFILQPISLD